MSWSKTLAFPRPPRDVSLGPPRPASGTDPELLRRVEDAYQRGLTDGEKRLGEQLLQQRAELQRLHTGVLHALHGAVTGVIHDTENTLVDLAFEVAQKVIAEVPISRELVEANIRSALAEAEDATEFFIHLHPEDLALLQRQSSELVAPEPRPCPMHFLAAPEIARGGCLVRTHFGVIDARRETRLQRLRQSLEP